MAVKSATWSVWPRRKGSITGEEIANAATHGLGALLSIAGLVLMLVRAVSTGSALFVVAVSIFGASLILLYLMSTFYHAITAPRAKKVFEILDHSAIYLLIAGTYTVYSLTVLQGALGWSLFGVIWACAIAGIAIEAFRVNRSNLVSVLLYVAMGWIVVFVIRPVYAALPLSAFLFLVAGGAAYTLGAVIYALKKIKWTHPVWHLFVLAGSILHFFSVMTAVGQGIGR